MSLLATQRYILKGVSRLGLSENTGSVSGGDFGPWSKAFLTTAADDDDGLDRIKDASQLSLIYRPVSPGAIALTAEVVAEVAIWETNVRPRHRGASGQAKLQAAVGAVIGGLLRNWRRDATASYRSRSKRAFDAGSPVAYDQFIPAIDGMVFMGFADQKAGIRWSHDIGDGHVWSDGSAARYWPLARLLRAAERHGVLPGTVTSDFVGVPSTVAPKVSEPIEVRAWRTRVKVASTRAKKRTKLPLLPLSALGEDLPWLLRAVEDANEAAAEHTVAGCLPPRWRAIYHASAKLGGRRYAVGSDGVYQQMSKDARRLILIDKEPVTECDVRASHLTLMHGLLGLPLPEGDPYAFDGLDRNTVKRWVTATLGKGSPVKAWSPPTLQSFPELAGVNPKALGVAVCARYPFLRAPAAAVASAAGLDKIADIAKPEALLTHRLMAIEAEAINSTAGHLQGEGVLALPMHDGLIVPLSAADRAQGYLRDAYSYFAKIRPHVTFSPNDGPAA